MLVVGLYLFTNKASVQTSFFSGNLSLFGLNVNSGLVIIPFIIGVVVKDDKYFNPFIEVMKGKVGA